MPTISRNEYVGLFGPTTGDRIRLGDTGLFVEIERDLRGAHGDEIVFGGGKSRRQECGTDRKEQCSKSGLHSRNLTGRPHLGYPRLRGKGFPWIEASRISMGWAAWTVDPVSCSTRCT